MCGIIALAGKNLNKIDDTKVKAMLSTLSFRGPDDQDFVRLGKGSTYAILGQTRLSIIDLSGGHQPMKDNTEDVTVTFNGEIYNYQELRKDLESRGHHFSTKSDTEAILKAYIEYGDRCVDQLDGMFAFVIWDNRNSKLFIARDRFGKKPLYYAFDKENNLIIASEIKAILATDLKGQIDPIAIDNYLALTYIPPWKTIYSNIKTLPPAHSAIYTNGKIEIKKYWKLEKKPIKVSYEDAKMKVKELFDIAVKKRMIADVEIGALLSGGVDSTLICAYAQKYSNHPLKTFSLGYGDLINELPYAKQASEKIGTDHYTLQASPDLTDELKLVTEYMDEPHSSSSNFPQHLVSKLASSKVKVALSGDGADELFMGYGWYWKYWNTSKFQRIKNLIFSNQFNEYKKYISIFSKKERQLFMKDSKIVNDDIIGEEATVITSNGINKINIFDLTTYLPGQLLVKVDRTSMMNSLEVRCPFLDYQLAEYVYSLPTEYKMDRKNGKIILKDILSEIIPKDFVYRKKQGFGAPVLDWLKTKKMETFVRNNLNSNALIYKYINKKPVEELLENFYGNNQAKMTKESKTFDKIWNLLCLELWLKSHKKYHE